MQTLSPQTPTSALRQQNVHLHMWARWKKLFKEFQFRCTHPDCTKVQPASLLLGKRALCGICKQNQFILTREDLRRAVPRCPDCSQTKDAVARRTLKTNIASSGIFDQFFAEPPQLQEREESKDF